MDFVDTNKLIQNVQDREDYEYMKVKKRIDKQLEYYRNIFLT